MRNRLIIFESPCASAESHSRLMKAWWARVARAGEAKRAWPGGVGVWGANTCMHVGAKCAPLPPPTPKTAAIASTCAHFKWHRLPTTLYNIFILNIYRIVLISWIKYILLLTPTNPIETMEPLKCVQKTLRGC